MNHAVARRRLFFSIIVQISLTVLILHCPTFFFQFFLFLPRRPAAELFAGAAARRCACSLRARAELQLAYTASDGVQHTEDWCLYRGWMTPSAHTRRAHGWSGQ
jgi:hypothetical protein